MKFTCIINKHLLTTRITEKYNLKNRILIWSIVFVLISPFLSSQIHSQTSNSSYISYSYLEVVQYSIKFSYSSSGSYSHYTPYLSYQNALATLQARYDYYHSIISNEYYKLKGLTLINETNQATLQSYKNQRLNWVYNAGSTWDLGNSTNSTNIINYCCEIYSYPTIKSELSLLQSCKVELDRIKYKDPDNYLYSKRYQSIMKTLDLLKTCSPSEIKNLSWEKTELENASNSNSSNSNNEYIKVTNSNYTYRRNSKSIQIDNITKTAEYTVIQFTTFPSMDYGSGWWVNFNSNAYIEQNGIKYYLKKAEGIPLSPNKHYFSNINESLSFKLFFSKSVDLNATFDLIEIYGSATAFNFYYISK